MMKIFIDADGCPVVAIVDQEAFKRDIPVVIVKNYNHHIESDHAEVITVDATRDSADYYIANHLSAGDLVVTQDYGLAAMVLSRGGLVLHISGTILDHDNIGGHLERRHMHQEQRRKHQTYSKIKKRTPEDNQRFLASLLKILD